MKNLCDFSRGLWRPRTLEEVTRSTRFLNRAFAVQVGLGLVPLVTELILHHWTVACWIFIATLYGFLVIAAHHREARLLRMNRELLESGRALLESYESLRAVVQGPPEPPPPERLQ